MAGELRSPANAARLVVTEENGATALVGSLNPSAKRGKVGVDVDHQAFDGRASLVANLVESDPTSLKLRIGTQVRPQHALT